MCTFTDIRPFLSWIRNDSVFIWTPKTNCWRFCDLNMKTPSNEIENGFMLRSKNAEIGFFALKWKHYHVEFSPKTVEYLWICTGVVICVKTKTPSFLIQPKNGQISVDMQVQVKIWTRSKEHYKILLRIFRHNKHEQKYVFNDITHTLVVNTKPGFCCSLFHKHVNKTQVQTFTPQNNCRLLKDELLSKIISPLNLKSPRRHANTEQISVQTEEKKNHKNDSVFILRLVFF